MSNSNSPVNAKYALSQDDAEHLAAVVLMPSDLRRELLLQYQEEQGSNALLNLFVQFIGLANSVEQNSYARIQSIAVEYLKMPPVDAERLRRITNHLLISLERLPATCVFVAATNALGLIDKALKRRFDFVLELPTPTADLKLRCASIELAHTLTLGTDLCHLIPRIAILPLQNLYEVTELCRSIRRDLVLNNGKGIERLLQAETMNN